MSHKSFDRKLIFVSLLLLIVIGAVVLFFGASEQCITKAEERIVRGDSLVPLIRSGDTVKILFGYYNCRKVKREDIVIYGYAGRENPIIKIVKGMPGDKFELRESNSGWNILINGQILQNSENETYFITGNEYQMLSLYEKDYEGRIPENAYLILGNLSGGSLDSTQFGLVDKADIWGKVIYY